MNIVVCAKQIPEPAAPMVLESASHTIVRTGRLVLDDSDMYGVELAIQLVEQHGGEVTVLSMVPRQEAEGVRTALAMGAHRAVLVSDDRLVGSDALSTAKVLAAVIGRLEVDLVIAATESTDGYTGTVPVQIAELLGLPAVTFVRQVSLQGNELHVHRQTEAGFDEVRCPLPAVLTVTAGVLEPRYPSFRGIMSARSKPLEILDLDALGIDARAVEPRQEIVEVRDAPAKGPGDIVADDGASASRIVALLERVGAL